MRWMLSNKLTAVLLLFLTVPVWSQDYDPPQDASRFTGSVSGSSSLLKRQELESKFILGFNWGELPQDTMSYKALHINVVHESNQLPRKSSNAYRVLSEWMPWGMGLIHCNDQIGHGGPPVPYAWSPSMQFDPVVGNRGSAYDFTPRLGDTTGAVWGFAFRDTEVGNVMPESEINSQIDNYGRIMFLDTNLRKVNQQLGLPVSTPRLVLSDPRPDILQFNDDIDKIREAYLRATRHRDSLFVRRSNEMFIRDNRDIPWQQIYIPAYQRNPANDTLLLDSAGQRIPGTIALEPWIDTTLRSNGLTIIHTKGDSTEWWLAANLRRLVNVDQPTVPSNTIVMSLRVPFEIRYDTVYYNAQGRKDWTHEGKTLDTVYARFDSAAVAGDTLIHPHYGIMDNQLASYDSTVFYIRAGMLPPYDNIVNSQPRPDITLSAHFWLPRFANNDRYKAYQPTRTSLGFLPYPGFLPPPPVVAPDTMPGFPRTDIVRVVVRVHMDVTYHGNVDIGLDWLRFESRLARMILRGQKEKL